MAAHGDTRMARQSARGRGSGDAHVPVEPKAGTRAVLIFEAVQAEVGDHDRTGAVPNTVFDADTEQM